MRSGAALAFAVGLSIASPAAAADHARLFVLTDIGNEPDDQMSLVRLLLYANEIDIAGIVATTSVWQREKVSPEIARQVIEAYGAVRPRLLEHAPGWPSAVELEARVHSGRAGYGLAAIDADKPSPGARALLAAARRDDPRPLWVALWGGANTLAEALAHARRTLTGAEVDELVARLRVYSISDQDDAGPWLRREFPKLFTIVTPSTQDGAEYARATWTGISGDRFYRNGNGADFATVSNEWLDANIRAKGPLGARYPKHMFIMEGDTPSFLGLIRNGLEGGDALDWGGWGGRYVMRQPYGETRPVWTQGGDSFPRVTSADTIGEVTSDQATIWRWREAFQHDFAARMDWTVNPYAKANHPPRVAIQGQHAGAPIRVTVQVGESVTLDASPSRDPDGDRLTYRWMHYPEAGFRDGVNMAGLRVEGADAPKATLTPTAACRPMWLDGFAPCKGSGIAHVILAVTDAGKPALTRYARVILTVKPRSGSRQKSSNEDK